MSNINGISQLIEQIEKNSSVAYFTAQLLTIICLFLYGLFFLVMLSDKDEKDSMILRFLLAFPFGLAIISLLAFVMVTFMIPYNAVSLVLACILFGVFVAYIKKNRLKNYVRIFTDGRAFLLMGAVLLFAVISCLGVISITVSNDSMYRASFYPRAIVYFGGIRENFATFLTDVGQGYALINSLPFLFGFNESFGIQNMLNFSVVALFCKALTECFCNNDCRNNRGAGYVLSVLCVLILICAMPYVLLSKWILSNMYFMAFVFIAAYLALRTSEKRDVSTIVLSIVAASLSTMRIEGGIYVTLFVLCISILDFSNKELGLGVLCPVMILHTAYAIRIFMTMELTDPYCFLTPKKAAIMIVIMLFALFYLVFIRGRYFIKLTAYTGLLIVLGEISINLILLVIKPAAFLGNLKSFVENVMFGGGWGTIPVTALGIYLICLFIDFKSFKWNFWDLMAISFLLYCVAVTFMREGGLRVSVGDSGNRVLMQCVPLIIFAAVSHINGILNVTIANKSE